MIDALNSFAAGRADALGKASWQGGLALIAVWCICRFVPRISPAFKMWLWRLAWIKLLLAFFWNGAIELPLLSPLPAVHPPQVAQAIQFAGALPDLAKVPVIQPNLNIVAVMFLIWQAAVLVAVLHLGRQWHRSARLKHESVPMENGVLGELCLQLRIRRPPALRQSNLFSVPVLIGILRPTVIVPGNANGNELRMMLAHELAHLKRRDLWWAWLPAICHALFFFHPLLWLTRREWLLAQEMACDELALRHSATSPASFANMLIDLAAAPVLRPRFGTIGIFETTQNLKRRILAMKITRNRKSRALMLALFVISGTGILPWRLVAQDKPEDAAKRIAQLERDNASLREEIEKLKSAGNRNQQKMKLDLLADRIQRDLAIATLNMASNKLKRAQKLSAEGVESPEVLDIARANVQRAETEIAARAKSIAEREAALAALGVNPSAAAGSNRKAQERELYLEELNLAEQYADSMRKQMQVGRGTLEELVRAQQQVFRLQREVAKLDGNTAQLRQVVQEEMKAVQRLLDEAKKRVEIGNAPPGHELDLQREMLKLKRELLQLED